LPLDGRVEKPLRKSMYSANVEKSIPLEQVVAKATSARKVKLTQRGSDKCYRTPMQWQARRRTAELTRIYRDQFPNGLPHNALGVKYARYMCRTMAFDPVDCRGQWLDRYAPWMDADTRAKILGLGPHWYAARSLGQHIELHDEDRERLEAWTIEAVDVTEEQREAINLDKRRKRQERYRRKKGVKPRDQSASRLKPWEKEGFNCRRTWERHRKRAEAVSQKTTAYSYLIT
jgi:hypothetical protein